MIPPNVGVADPLARISRSSITSRRRSPRPETPHAVFLSSVGSQHASGTGPIAGTHYGEVVLARTATRLTFVRAAGFMENVLANAFTMKSDGVLPVFGGGETEPITMVATRDIGDVAADALLSPPSATEWIELHGPRDVQLRRCRGDRERGARPPGHRDAGPDRAGRADHDSHRILGERRGALPRDDRRSVHAARSNSRARAARVKGTTELADVLRRGLA